MACYQWFLSEREALDITVAAFHATAPIHPDCPEALRKLLAAMSYVEPEVHAVRYHPDFYTNRKRPETWAVWAYGIMARAAARVAREYWDAENARRAA